MAEKFPVTLKIPYFSTRKPIHKVRTKDVFIVKSRKAPRKRPGSHTIEAGEIVLELLIPKP